MTRITFYVVNGSIQQGLHALCRVAGKATEKGHRLYVNAPDDALRSQFDDMLWTYSDRSFVAHDIDPAAEAPVLIGATEPPEGYDDILMNLGDDIPPGFSRCERVIELVAGDEPQRQAARARWKHYQERGYPLESHEI